MNHNSRNSSHRSGDAGYTMIEILIVAAVIAILMSVAVFLAFPTKTAYSADDAANQLMSFIADANQRAVWDHHSMRLVINLNTNRITEVDEKTKSGGGNNEGDSIQGDDVMIRQAPLVDRVAIGKPSGISATPPAPLNFSPPTFVSKVWTVHFQSDGSVQTLVSGALTPVSSTFYFQSLDNTTNNFLVRAVTLYAATSAAREWAYNGSAYAAE